MTNAKCRNCDNDADAGGYCSSCAAAIMAKALNHYFDGKCKKEARPELTRSLKSSVQPSLFRSRR